MTQLDVRIVRLEPARVASAYGFGPNPEIVAGEKILAFLKAKRLLPADGAYQSYGFNNPNPSPGSPNYGYEIWVPVGPEVEPEGDIRIVDFAGGLYAVTHCQGVSGIGDVWRHLVVWREDSPYKPGHHQWLEHLLNPQVPDFEQYEFDLYLPIVD